MLQRGRSAGFPSMSSECRSERHHSRCRSPHPDGRRGSVAAGHPMMLMLRNEPESSLMCQETVRWTEGFLQLKGNKLLPVHYVLVYNTFNVYVCVCERTWCGSTKGQTHLGWCRFEQLEYFLQDKMTTDHFLHVSRITKVSDIVSHLHLIPGLQQNNLQ